MKCPKCGIYTSEKYCPDCGVRLAPIRKKPKQSKGVTVTKLVIGIFSIILFVLVMLQACAVTSVGVFVSEETAASGLVGVMVAFLMLAAGIVGITTRTKPKGGLVASAMWFIAAFMGFAASSVYGDMSVWGFLALVFGIVYFVSTFLSFYKGSFYRKWWFYALTVLMIIAVLGMVTRNVQEEADRTEEPVVEATEADMSQSAVDNTPSFAPDIPTDAVEPLPTNKVPGVLETEDFTLKYVSHSVVEDDYGTSCLNVVFEFTHNQTEPTSFDASVYCKAFQEGIQLDTGYYSNDECEGWGTQVQANTAIRVDESFELRNTETPVDLIISEYLSFSDDPKMEMTLNLK